MKIMTQGREMMCRVRQGCTIVALSLAGMLVLDGVSDAYAQKSAQKKKLTYEQAFALCKKDVDRIFPAKEFDTAGRYARGGSA